MFITKGPLHLIVSLAVINMLRKMAGMQIPQYILQILWTLVLEPGIMALHSAK